MNIKRIRVPFAMLLFFISLIGIGKIVAAQTMSAFSVSPLNPETNQPQSSYYELTGKPNTKQKITLRVFNSSDHAIQIQLEANNGSTNNNGITSYLKEGDRDATLKVGFADIATCEAQPMNIPANDSKDVSVTIQYPKKEFKGVILGGLRLYEVTEEEKQVKDVTNHVAYTVGVVLQESNEKISPEMHLLSAQPEQRNYHNYISATLQNAAPTIIKTLNVKATVYKKSGKKKMYAHESNNLRMAPNSKFNYGINLEDQALKNGTYLMAVKGDADGVPFNFEKEFTIDKKEAKQLNENAVFVKGQAHIPMWMILIGILISIVLLGLLIYIFKLKVGEKNE